MSRQNKSHLRFVLSLVRWDRITEVTCYWNLFNITHTLSRLIRFVSNIFISQNVKGSFNALCPNSHNLQCSSKDCRDSMSVMSLFGLTYFPTLNDAHECIVYCTKH